MNAISFLWVENSHIWVGLLKVVETICGRHEDAVGFRSLLLGGSEGSGRVGGFTLNCEIKLTFGHLVNLHELPDVLAWVRALLGVQP